MVMVRMSGAFPWRTGFVRDMTEYVGRKVPPLSKSAGKRFRGAESGEKRVLSYAAVGSGADYGGNGRLFPGRTGKIGGMFS